MIINEKAREFICNLNYTRGLGYSDVAVLTHAWHESAGFTKIIGEWNCWGIKTPSKSTWNGMIVEAATHEYEQIVPSETEDQALVRIIKKYGTINAAIARRDGRWYVSLPQQFRDWPTCEQAMVWYCDFIARLYRPAYNARKNPEEYFKGLVAGPRKYATDPNYVKALTALSREIAENVLP